MAREACMKNLTSGNVGWVPKPRITQGEDDFQCRRLFTMKKLDHPPNNIANFPCEPRENGPGGRTKINKYVLDYSRFNRFPAV